MGGLSGCLRVKLLTAGAAPILGLLSENFSALEFSGVGTLARSPAVGLGNTSLYLATRHHFGWYALKVLEPPPHVIALQLGHPDGGQLVFRKVPQQALCVACADRAGIRYRPSYRREQSQKVKRPEHACELCPFCAQAGYVPGAVDLPRVGLPRAARRHRFSVRASLRRARRGRRRARSPCRDQRRPSDHRGCARGRRTE